MSSSDDYYTGLADNSDEDTADEDIPPKIKPRFQHSSSQMSALGVPPLPQLLSPRQLAPIPSAQAQVVNNNKATLLLKKYV